MSQGVEILLNQMLAENMMLVSFLGVSLLLTGSEGPRTAIRSGLGIAGTVIVASLVGSILASVLPGGEIIRLFAFLVITLCAVGALRAGGLLTDERFGLPSPIFALPLLFGSQFMLYELQLDFELTFAAAIGAGIGVYIAYVLAGSMNEQIRLTETGSLMKGVPALVLALGLLAFAMSGFQLL